MRPALTLSGGLSSSFGSDGGASMMSNSTRTPTMLRVELDVEPRQPLGRLVGQQECGEEGEELARRRTRLDDAIAAVDHRQRDGEAAERLHQRACAVRDPRPAVGFFFELGDVGMHARAHLVFKRERLDRAHALHRLLQALEQPRAADELAQRNMVDAANHLAQHEQRGRHDHQADQRHPRILQDHHSDQRNHRQEIAAERAGQQVQHVARGGRAGVEARHEFRGVTVGEVGEVLPDQRLEHAPLVFGDDAVADPGHDQRVAVGRQPPSP